jgi:hypothetical protein
MPFPWFTMLVLSLSIAFVPSTALGLADEQVSTARTVVVCGDGDDAKTVTVHVEAAPECQGRYVVIAKSAGEDQPKVWIGVRLTPVPAPLAAHIGADGVMIANVVKDSPADKAGLEQYDVIVGFGGSTIKGPQDLTDAIAKAEPGQAAKLTVTRKGAKQELEIKPVERPAETEMEMKYAEPEASSIDDAVKMYGRALMVGPNGQWTSRDLGSLKHMPDTLKGLGQSLDDLDRNLDFRILRELDEPESAGAAADSSARVEVRVQVEDDGQTTTIMRDPDGKIHVTHKDAEGKESSATYDDADALEKANPEAYKLYERYDGHATSDVIRIRPYGNQARQWRQEFQVDVEKKVNEALAQSLEAYGKASERAAKVAKEAEQELQKKLAEVHARRVEKGAAAPEKEILIVRVDPKGAIHVTVTQDGEKKVYQFKNKDDFKATEPDLYGQVEDALP